MEELRAEMRRERMAADARIRVLEDDMRTLRAEMRMMQSEAQERAPPPPPERAPPPPPERAPANTSNKEIRTPDRNRSFTTMMAAYPVGADAPFFRAIQSRARVNEDVVAEGLAGTIAGAFAREAALSGGAPLSIDSETKHRHAFLIWDGSVWQPMMHSDFVVTFRALMKRLTRAYREARGGEGVAGAADFLKVTEATAWDVGAPRFVQLARRKLYEALSNARAA